MTSEEQMISDKQMTSEERPRQIASAAEFVKRHAGLLTALLLFTAGLVLHALGSRAYGLDDAYISFRYAKNFFNGLGLVFNPGEYVEGYSNFLYVLLLTPGFFFVHADNIFFWSLGLNWLFGAATLVVLYARLSELYDVRTGVAGAIIFAASHHFWKVANDGLETPLVLFLQISLWALLTRPADTQRTYDLVLLCVASAALILSRADGFVMPAIVLAYLVYAGRYRAGAVFGAASGLTVALYVAWRYNYYGYPLPNTYYAKVSGTLIQRIEHGFDHFMRYMTNSETFPYFVILIFALLAHGYFLARGRLSVRTAVPPELFMATGWFAYLMYVGGDVLGIRFLMIILLLTVAALFRLHHLFAPRAQVVLIALVLVAIQLHRPLMSRNLYPFEKSSGWRQAGIILREEYPGASIAVDAAGKLPYFSGLDTIDILGLTDEHTAHLSTTNFVPGHNKADPSYIFGRKPDLIGSWVDKEWNLVWGMPRERYEAEGYRLRYLVAPMRAPQSKSVVDARGYTEEQLAFIRGRGARWAILERVPRVAR